MSTTSDSRITDVIRADHAWFRSHFERLDNCKSTGADDAAAIWHDVAMRLEQHATAEEEIFYPRLLDNDDSADAKDETRDAIKDHDEIREGIREASEAAVMSESWWAAVAKTRKANDDHMAEEEEDDGPLRDFENVVPEEDQRSLAGAFADAETHAHATGRGDVRGPDPDAYVAEHSEDARA